MAAHANHAEGGTEHFGDIDALWRTRFVPPRNHQEVTGREFAGWDKARRGLARQLGGQYWMIRRCSEGRKHPGCYTNKLALVLVPENPPNLVLSAVTTRSTQPSRGPPPIGIAIGISG
jgi:hypothetical protein